MDQPFFDTIEPGPDAEEHFRQFGWVLTEPLRPEAVAELRSWVDDLMMWPDDGPWLHYREATANGPRLCRTENFVPFHDELRELLTRSELSDTASILLDEPAAKAVAAKGVFEELNKKYKLEGLMIVPPKG